MTPSARTVLPTDLVALVSHDGDVYANEAMTRDRVGSGDSPSPLETAFEQWLSFATGRHTCVSVKGATLQGLVSARKRGSKQTWEIDCLIDAARDNGVLLSLLDRITDAAGKAGAMRLFLRLPPGATEEAASRAAFTPYLREQVWVRRDPVNSGANVAPDLRRRTKLDLFAIFQLYNRVTPVEIRRVEGMTFNEWSASQETLGRATQFVVGDDERIRGWLRVAGDGDIGRFDLMGEPRLLEPLLQSALAKVSNRERAVTIVPEYAVELQSHLERAGFEPQEEYVVQSRRTVRPVKVAQKMPALAHTSLI
jgi:hypothetical protein